MTEPRPFWPHLVANRNEAQWGNFAWFSARTLLQSINDQIAHQVEEPDDPGSIVDRRRMRWVAQQQARGVDADIPLRITDSRGFLALGDPGEMDASQYVLIRDLAAATGQLSDEGVKTALLMSDVVYPAGDINQWVDAVYLPYFGLPEQTWDAAGQDWVAKGGGPVFDAPLRHWNVLAMPGNHDWYDGLNGFMYHACCAEPLPDISYDDAGMTVRQRIARTWWRNPSAPKRELIAHLRHEVAYRPKVGMPTLPGPYYAVDLGCPGHEDNTSMDHTDCMLLRLVVLDNGITGTIDVEQANWLERMLAPRMRGDGTPLPVVVATGKPIVVNNKVNPMPVAERPATNPSRAVLSILQEHAHVVATIAGDIHNYQRIQLQGPKGHKLLQIVSGGAGAFLAATHTVRFNKGDALPVNTSAIEGTNASLDPVVASGDHHRYPSRAGSILHYAVRVPRPYALVVGVIALAGLAGLRLTARTAPTADALFRGDQDLTASRIVLTGWLALIWMGGAGVGVWLMRRMRRDRKRAMLMCAVALAGPVGLVAELGHVARPAGLAAALLAAGFIVLLVLAQVVPPVLDSYPRLRKGLAARVAVGAFLALLWWRLGVDVWKGLVAVALVAITVRVLVLLARAIFESDGLASETGKSKQVRAAFSDVAPFLLTALLLVLTTLAWPSCLALLLAIDQEDRSAVGDVVRLLSASTLAVTSAAALVPAVAMPIRHAWRFAPRTVIALLTVGLMGGMAAGFLATAGLIGGLKGPGWVEATAACLTGLLLLPLGGVLGCALVTAGVAALSRTVPSSADVDLALARRDGASDLGPSPSLELFTAMTIAAIPSLESMAEAAQPPFAKNILVVDVPGDANVIRFRAYGLDDESPEPSGLPTTDTPATSGFFLIDQVEVAVTALADPMP